MKDFDIAKYLREHQLGSYGILNHYVDLKPLKEEANGDNSNEYINSAIDNIIINTYGYTNRNSSDAQDLKSKIINALSQESDEQKSAKSAELKKLLISYGKDVLEYNRAGADPHGLGGQGVQIPSIQLPNSIVDLIKKLDPTIELEEGTQMELPFDSNPPKFKKGDSVVLKKGIDSNTKIPSVVLKKGKNSKTEIPKNPEDPEEINPGYVKWFIEQDDFDEFKVSKTNDRITTIEFDGNEINVPTSFLQKSEDSISEDAFEGTKPKLTGNGEGDEFEQAETVSEIGDSESEFYDTIWGLAGKQIKNAIDTLRNHGFEDEDIKNALITAIDQYDQVFPKVNIKS